MPEIPYAWLGDVQSFLGTPEEEILRELTRFARETGPSAVRVGQQLECLAPRIREPR